MSIAAESALENISELIEFLFFEQLIARLLKR